MSDKLTFKEWFFQCGFHKDGYDCNQVSSAHSAWHFCQAQEQKEYQLLEEEHSILLAQFSKVDIERLKLEKKVEDLERDNSELSAGCCTELLCGDGGNPTCKARIENESLKKKLEACQECDYDNCKGCKLFEGE